MKKQIYIVVCIITVLTLGVFLLLNKTSEPLSISSVSPEEKSDTEMAVSPSEEKEVQKMPFRPTRLPPQPIVESSALPVAEPNKSKLSDAVEAIVNGSDNSADYNDYRVAMLQLTRSRILQQSVSSHLLNFGEHFYNKN
jgi:hypothetical protein